MDFLRIRRRTWISHGHIWLGRWAVVAGWVNVVLGLLLSGHSRVDVWGVGIFMGMEAVVVAWWVWRAAQQRKAMAGENGGQNGKGTMDDDGEVESHALMARNGGAGADGEYFRLSMSEDDLSSSEDEEEGKRGNGVRGGR